MESGGPRADVGLGRDALRADIHDRVFRLAEEPPASEGLPAPSREPPGAYDDAGHDSPLEDPFPRLEPPPPPPRRIGAEVELIPLAGSPPRACRIHERTLPWLRRHAAANGWSEDGAAAVPRFLLPEGGVLFFEPGGQLEYASAPHWSPSTLLATLRSVVEPLVESARFDGVDLVGLGVDPVTPASEVPLQLHSPRYVRMDRYFSHRGPAGPRMMRQTASCQVNLDFPSQPLLGWRAMNAAAPYLVALFANSARYAAAPTGHPSFRSVTWQRLDPTRTGIFRASVRAEEAVEEYLEFALAAPWFLGSDPAVPFSDRLRSATTEEWRAHLTTLFPEIRPRGYLELRCIDALPPAGYPAPIVLLEGLLHHRPSLEEAVERLGLPSRELLVRAGEVGLAEPRLRSGATLLARLGLAGAEALGPAVVNPADLAAAADFFERYTLAGRCPADDPVPVAA